MLSSQYKLHVTFLSLIRGEIIVSAKDKEAYSQVLKKDKEASFFEKLLHCLLALLHCCPFI